MLVVREQISVLVVEMYKQINTRCIKYLGGKTDSVSYQI